MLRPIGWNALAFAALTCSCAGADAPTATRTTVDSVEVVSSRGDLPELDVRLDTLALLGGDDAGPTSFFRVRPTLVDVDSVGIIYVLDRSLNQVVGLSHQGAVVSTWGREGEGPGELKAPLSVSVSPDGEPTVHDAGRGVFVTYAPDGSLRREQPAPYTIFNIAFRQFEITPPGITLWLRDPARTTIGQRHDRLTLVAAGDTATLLEGRPSYRSEAYHPACQTTFSVPMPLSPRIYWAQVGSTLAVVTGPGFRIDLYDGATLSRRIEYGESVGELTRREAIELLEARGARGPCNAAPADLVEKHGFFAQPQIVRGVALEPSGTLWIAHQSPSGVDRIALFDHSGAPIGVLPLGAPLPIAFLPDGRALVQVVDSLDVERIGVVVVRSPRPREGQDLDR
jgi:hypothetical protein